VLVTLFGSAASFTVVFVALFVIARALIPLFAMDAPDAGTTATGRLHNLLAWATFGPITVAAFLAGGVFHNGGFADAATWSTAFGVVMLLGELGMVLGRPFPALRAYFGLAERVVYLGFIGWFIVVITVGLTGVPIGFIP
jgi:hypothetical protein